MCKACVEVLAVAGAGITLMGGEQAGPLCVSSPAIGELEDAQFMNGAGPSPDAFRLRIPVFAPRFDTDHAAQWPSFVDLAHSRGILAAFAFPLSLAGATVGVLSLYQQERGDLSPAQHEDSAAMVEILTETLLSLQDAAPPGVLADGLEDAVLHRAEIHQASGMVASHLQIPVAEALVRIRAHAFAIAKPVRDVASDIVGRRLRLVDDRIPPIEGA
jgi:hypothetical protein